MDKWLLNGIESGSVSLDDRGLNYGDGLFETIALRSGAYRFIDAHLSRLQAGCQRLKISGPDTEILLSEIRSATGQSKDGTVKIIVTRGSGPRGYRPSAQSVPTRIVGFTAEQPVLRPDAGIRIRFCSTLISRNRQFAGIKTLNRLEQVMARAEWSDPHVTEGLMLNDKGEVVCGTMTNIFCTRNDVLMTPELNECGVKGVMRAKTLEVAKSLGIEIQECSMDKRDLMHADDLFLTNALTGAVSVNELDGRLYTPSALTRQIRKGLYELGVEECAS